MPKQTCQMSVQINKTGDKEYVNAGKINLSTEHTDTWKQMTSDHLIV